MDDRKMVISEIGAVVAAVQVLSEVSKEDQGKMNQELEQSDENQDRLDEQQEKSDSNQDQLIEIYKLQAQLANSISNRRITINRFYILVMSGLVLLFPAYFKLPDEIRDVVSIELLMIGAALLGTTLSLAWFILINSNLRLSMLKYEALKKLENKLEYQFFKDEWGFLERYGKIRTYWEISYIEILIPILFFFIFASALSIASVNPVKLLPDKVHIFFLAYPLILFAVFCFYGIRSWQIDREIREIKRWTDKKIVLVSLFVILICISPFFLFRDDLEHMMRFRYRIYAEKHFGLIYEEAGKVIEKRKLVESESAKKNSEKSIIERITLPDVNQAKSVDEKPIETDSEETTKEQTTQSDGKKQNGHQ